MVKSPKADYSGDKGKGNVGNKPRLEPCWSMLLIGSLGAMWAWWGKQFHEPKCGSRHVCRVIAWTRQQGLVPYIGFEKVHGGPLQGYRSTFSFLSRGIILWIELPYYNILMYLLLLHNYDSINIFICYRRVFLVFYLPTPRRLVPIDHPDRQKKFCIDYVISLPWIFQT